MKSIHQSSFNLFSAIGVGIVHVNIATLGAEQARDNTGRINYFHLYYIAVNFGAALGYVLSVFWIERENIFIYFGCLFVSAVLFASGYKSYYHVAPSDSVFFILLPQFCNGLCVWLRLKFRGRKRYENMHDSFSSRNHPVLLMDFGEQSILEYAKESRGGDYLPRQVNDTQQILRLTALFLIMLPFWLVLVQVIRYSPENYLGYSFYFYLSELA